MSLPFLLFLPHLRRVNIKTSIGLKSKTYILYQAVPDKNTDSGTKGALKLNHTKLL